MSASSLSKLTDHFELDHGVDCARLFEIHPTAILSSVSGLNWINLKEGRYVVLIEVYSLYADAQCNQMQRCVFCGETSTQNGHYNGLYETTTATNTP